MDFINNIFNTIITRLEYFIDEYGFKILGAILILALGVLTAIFVYKGILYLFKKFKLIELLEKIELDIYKEHDEEETVDEKGKKEPKQHKAFIFKKKIKVDSIVAKATSYYIFLLFFRWSMVQVGVTEIEQFLKDLIAYLPSLFVGILIGYFGIRFANFIFDVVYHALQLTKQKTAKIIASGAKIIILFFTLMLVLDYTKIMDRTIIDTIFIGFISMLTIAGGLAFGLGGRDIAKEILESFRK